MRQQAEGERIGQMTANTLVAKMGVVLKEICLMSDLKIEDSMSVEFTKSFIRFIKAHYSDLTPAELVWAFSLNAANELPSKTVCYGSNLSVPFIGGVLSSYRQKRNDLARKIKELRHPEIQEQEPTEEDKRKQSQAFCQDFYQKWLDRELTEVSMSYAHMVYSDLDQMGYIRLTVDEKKEYHGKAQVIRDRELAAPVVDWHKRKENHRIMEDYLNDMIKPEEKTLVKQYAMRLALLDQFAKWKETGKLNIFGDENDHR